jgi:uncharacterized protein YjcR
MSDLPKSCEHCGHKRADTLLRPAETKYLYPKEELERRNARNAILKAAVDEDKMEALVGDIVYLSMHRWEFERVDRIEEQSEELDRMSENLESVNVINAGLLRLIKTYKPIVDTLIKDLKADEPPHQ